MFQYMGYGFEALPRQAARTADDPRYLSTLKLCKRVTRLLKKAEAHRAVKEEWEHMYALEFLRNEGLTEEYLAFIGPLRIRSSMAVARFFYYFKTLLGYSRFLPPGPWNVLEIGAGAGNYACFLQRGGRVRNYVIVDLPEMLLHSSHTVAKYIPSAKITFDDPSGFDPSAPGVNFYFLPPPGVKRLPAAAFDLCLNFNSFMEMDADVRDGYIAEVYRLGRPGALFYNVNRRQRALPQRDGSIFDNNPLFYPYRATDRVLLWEEDKFQQATRSWFLKVPSLAVARIAVINPSDA
jgi:putative sugar O-methyltransferase